MCDSVPFQCLNFSTRTKNCLMFSGAQSIGDVVRLIESGKLKNLRQCGQGTIQNIIDVLEKALPFHFILGKPAQFCPETSDAFTRKEHTRQLSAMLERYIDPRNDPRIYWAREVTFDYSTNHKIRVDYMRFQPLNNSTSGIEKGDFYAYEVKSSVEDFKSPNGHNFIADYNYYVMPADVFEAVKDTVPYGVGVLCPDGGHLRCVRKAVRKDRTRPVSEMLLMLWRSSRRDFPATDVAPVMHTRWAHLGGDEWCCPACGFVITTEGSWDKPTKNTARIAGPRWTEVLTMKTDKINQPEFAPEEWRKAAIMYDTSFAWCKIKFQPGVRIKFHLHRALTRCSMKRWTHFLSETAISSKSIFVTE